MGQRGASARTIVVLVDSTHVETHHVDLPRCWEAWRAIQGAEGRLHTYGELAAAANVSNGTVRRFMRGSRPVSLRSGYQILEALKLEFDQVATPLTPALQPAC